MSAKPATRPPWCIEDNCEPALGCWDDLDVRLGGSGICGGCAKNPDPLRFVAQSVQHATNAAYVCWYTPLKGWTKFMVDEGDCQWVRLVLAAIEKRKRWNDFAPPTGAAT